MLCIYIQKDFIHTVYIFILVHIFLKKCVLILDKNKKNTYILHILVLFVIYLLRCPYTQMEVRF